jgi:hypothetical protein
MGKTYLPRMRDRRSAVFEDASLISGGDAAFPVKL